MSVILNGYVPQMQREPERYKEGNNKSYKDERVWANEAVYKLQRAKIVRETKLEELWCVNPLTVAKNAKGKRRLCIDLSRCVNKVIKAPKFKIQSTMAALQIVERGDWMFSFDLKSAYLQVPINENFVKWFGFSIDEDDGSRRYFFYKQMPFGLNDACRVLTKLLRSPLERWRRQGINVYLQVDNGLGIVQGKEAAVRASECVRNDLKRYGLESNLVVSCLEIGLYQNYHWQTPSWYHQVSLSLIRTPFNHRQESPSRLSALFFCQQTS